MKQDYLVYVFQGLQIWRSFLQSCHLGAPQLSNEK